MSKPLHPTGTHVLKLVSVNKSKYGPLGAQCIFEGTGSNKGCYTISRFISKYGKWAKTSHGFLSQLKGFKDGDITAEISRFIGQDFLCVILKNGKSEYQMNISRFLELPEVSEKESA